MAASDRLSAALSRRQAVKLALAGAAVTPLAVAAQAPVFGVGIEGQRKADLGNGTFRNPIVPGDHADPTILKDGVVEGPTGDWWMVYHGYENGFRTLGRQALLEPVEWTPDGWLRAKGGSLDKPLRKPRTDGKTWKPHPWQMEVSGLHHNVFGGFVSLRLALFSAGPGEVRLRNFVYKGIPA